MKIWFLAYANNMVLVAKNRKTLVDIMKTLKDFLKKKGLRLNTDKTKWWCLTRKEEKKRRFGSGMGKS